MRGRRVLTIAIRRESFRGAAVYVSAPDKDCAAVIVIQACDSAQKSRFAGAVAAYECCQCGCVEPRVDIFQKRAVAESYSEVFQFYHAVDLLRHTIHTTTGIPSRAVIALTGNMKSFDMTSQPIRAAAPVRAVAGRRTRWSEVPNSSLAT